MKKSLFISIFLFAAYIVNAQSFSSQLPEQNSFLNKNDWKFHAPAQKLFQTFPYTQMIKSKNNVTDNMPVTGKIPAPVFAVNNGNGLDIYRSPLDNMLIAKPDLTFHSNMPVKTTGVKKYSIIVSPNTGGK